MEHQKEHKRPQVAQPRDHVAHGQLEAAIEEPARDHHDHDAVGAALQAHRVRDVGEAGGQHDGVRAAQPVQAGAH